jgi:hypothetical protein
VRHINRSNVVDWFRFTVIGKDNRNKKTNPQSAAGLITNSPVKHVLEEKP